MDHLSQRLLAASACAALLASPGTALAQPDTFAAGLSAFSDAVAGTYGDEGAHIAPALEKMAAGLAQWDREIQELEARLASGRRDAAPTLAARLRTAAAMVD